MRRRASRLLGPLILGVFAASLLFWGVRTAGRLPALPDPLLHVLPEKAVTVEALREGRLPLWNPWVACGTPHLARLQPGVFYPPFWIWAVTGVPGFLVPMALLHAAFAALGFFLWLRRRLGSPSGVSEALAAVSFGGGALSVSLWGLPTHLASLSWIPWVFLSAERLAERPGPPRAAALAAAFALQFLAGYPHFSLYTALFTLGLFAASKPSPRAWGWLAGAGVFSLALAAVQLLPFLDLLGWTVRPGAAAHPYSLEARHFLTLLSPSALGWPGSREYLGSLAASPYNLHLGLAALAAALLAFRVSGAPRIFAAAALLLAFFLAGVRGPLGFLLPEDIWALLEPAKAAPVFLAAALAAAASAWTRTEEWRGGRRVAARIFAGLWMAEALFLPFRYLETVKNPYGDPAVRRNARAVAGLAGGGRYLPLRAADQEPADQQAYLWESVALLFPNANAVFGVRSPSFNGSLEVEGRPNLDLYAARGFPYEGRVFDTAGVRLFALREKLPPLKYREAERRDGWIFQENAGAQPLVWQAPFVREFDSRAQALEALSRPDAFPEAEVFTEDGPGGKAVLLPPPQRRRRTAEQLGLFTRLLRALKFRGKRQPLRMERLGPGELSVEGVFRERGYLVSAESFAPGWRAWVDGEPMPIFRAYGLFQAVLVKEPGRHRVEFRYEPAAFRLGFFISLLALGVLAAGGRWVFSEWMRGFWEEAQGKRHLQARRILKFMDTSRR